MPKNATAEMQLYCIEDIRRRILEAEEKLRQLRIAEHYMTTSPGTATIIVTVFPKEGSDALKVETESPWGEASTLMRNAEVKFIRANAREISYGERRMLVRIEGGGSFDQIGVPQAFWSSVPPNARKS